MFALEITNAQDARAFFNAMQGKQEPDWESTVKAAAAKFAKPFTTDELCKSIGEFAHTYQINKVEPILFKLGYTREVIGKYRDYPAQPIRYNYKCRWSKKFGGYDD